MKKLFFGLCLSLLTVHISLGGTKIDLLPNFAGYVLLALGFSQLASQCPGFARLVPWSWGLAVYTGFLYVLKFFAFPVQTDLILWFLGLVGVIFGILLRGRLVRGIGDLETSLSRPLQADRLLLMWKFEAALCVISYLVNWIPLVSSIGLVAADLVAICFLAAFYRSWKLYR